MKNSRMVRAHQVFDKAAQTIDILISAMSPGERISMKDVLEVISETSDYGDFLNAQVLRLYRIANPKALVGIRGQGLFHQGRSKVRAVGRDGKPETKMFPKREFLRSFRKAIKAA